MGQLNRLVLLAAMVSVGIVGCSKPEEGSRLFSDCVNDGVAYFKEIGSYPTLKYEQDAGKTAESVANERCLRYTGAFDGQITEPKATTPAPTPTAPKPVKPKKQEGKRLTIPSDSAEYYVLDKAKRGAESVIITKRVGSDGNSYSSRLYNCQDSTVKYIGTGETRQAMEQSSPDPNMTPIIDGSIAYYVGVEACKQ